MSPRRARSAEPPTGAALGWVVGTLAFAAVLLLVLATLADGKDGIARGLGQVVSRQTGAVVLGCSVVALVLLAIGFRAAWQGRASVPGGGRRVLALAAAVLGGSGAIVGAVHLAVVAEAARAAEGPGWVGTEAVPGPVTALAAGVLVGSALVCLTVRLLADRG